MLVIYERNEHTKGLNINEKHINQKNSDKATNPERDKHANRPA